MKPHSQYVKFALSTALALCLNCKAKETRSECRWDMINVNHDVQGDAHLISGPNHRILVDTGAAKYAKTVLLPYLLGHRVVELEAVIITHPHFDHYGGLAELIKSPIKIKSIYMTPPSKSWGERETPWGVNRADIDNILRLAKELGVPVKPIGDFEKVDLGAGFVFEKVFWASENELREMGVGPDINELSLIARLRGKGFSALFTGDINQNLSGHLAKEIPGQLTCDILKFPHHGAEGFAKDEFIKLTKAKTFLVPVPKTLFESERCQRTHDLAKKMNASVYSNGQHGNVSIIIDKGKCEIITENDSEGLQ